MYACMYTCLYITTNTGHLRARTFNQKRYFIQHLKLATLTMLCFYIAPYKQSAKKVVEHVCLAYAHNFVLIPLIFPH